MKFILKIIAGLIVAILIISSIYIISTNDNEDKNKKTDNEEPKIESITEDTTGTSGMITPISVVFSDNVNVTTATIYYKAASASNWNSASILSGSIDIQIPSDSNENWYYYVTADDAAGNGPVGDPSVDGSVYYIITITEPKKEPRKVFIEEGSSSGCSNCPFISNILHQVYDPANPNFYYVSLINENPNAEDRLVKDYNINGFPTVFFDGGYYICCLNVAPEERNVALFEEKISKAASRVTPHIYLDVNSKWNESREELETTVIIENNENYKYTGFLKVYITEKISTKWSDWNGNPYHFAFLDFSINKEVSIEENSKETFSKKWLASSSGFSDIYPENLWIVAALFNQESTKKYSDNPRNENPFNAHFVDATDATSVLNGSLPPGIGISFPQKWNRYILGIKIGQPRLVETLIIGRIKIKLNIDAEAGIDKAEIKIKSFFKEETVEIKEAPYEWIWDTSAFGKYTIIATVYDKEGRIATDSLDVIAFILGEI